MISLFFVLSPRGDSIILRDFRGDLPKGTPDNFFRTVKFWTGDAPPAFNIDGLSFMFIKKNGLYFVAATTQNMSPALGIELLNRITKLIKDFLGVLNEDVIRKNFVLVYEILDEVLDYGYPQITATEFLKSCIHNEAVPDTIPEILANKGLAGLSEAVGNIGIGGIKLSTLTNIGGAPKTVASTAVQRPVGPSSGNQSDKNEIFADIIERLTIVMSSSGTILNSSIDGSIQLKSYLAGQPQIRLGLNEDLQIGRDSSRNNYGQVILDDCNFHECVDLKDFDSSRCLIFNAPEGEFSAMNYRIQSTPEHFRTPLRIVPSIVLMSPTRLEIIIRVRADINTQNNVSNLELNFALPSTAVDASVDCLPATLAASGEYVSSKNSVVVMCKKLPGGQELSCCIRVTSSQPFTTLASAKRECGPITLGFSIPMFTASNLQIKYLRIGGPYSSGSGNKNPPHKWIRYVTESNAYECRIN
eukprot:GDKJ01013351.1.p1 GENE.GDKJ01013351.1~~GDKJ01013351.1.p1  ORF type:complete len:472 (+),score=94.82 GDKJ01013351.1:41-1456(+)